MTIYLAESLTNPKGLVIEICLGIKVGLGSEVGLGIEI